MGKFRKKPVVIDAVQFHVREHSDNPLVFEETPEWLHKAIRDLKLKPVFKSEDYWYLEIETLEGIMLCSPGDWIIRGVQGEHYPCKPDIFEATYEPVD